MIEKIKDTKNLKKMEYSLQQGEKDLLGYIDIFDAVKNKVFIIYTVLISVLIGTLVLGTLNINVLYLLLATIFNLGLFTFLLRPQQLYGIGNRPANLLNSKTESYKSIIKHECQFVNNHILVNRDIVNLFNRQFDTAIKLLPLAYIFNLLILL